VVSFTPRPLYLLGKSLWYPLDRRLGGPQSWSGRGSEEKNSQPPQGIDHRTPIVQPVPQRYTDGDMRLEIYKKVLVEKLEGKRPLEVGGDLCTRGTMIFNYVLKK
jgi:hypothetical protein